MKRAVFFFLLGVLVGAAGFWFLQPPVDHIVEERAVGDLRERLIGKLEALDLDADHIRGELERSRTIVRRKAREIGAVASDAAADTRITAEIKAKLATDAELSAWRISVSTTDGRVTLAGSVDSPALIGKAIMLALDTEGVREVASTLIVKQASTTDNPSRAG